MDFGLLCITDFFFMFKRLNWVFSLFFYYIFVFLVFVLFWMAEESKRHQKANPPQYIFNHMNEAHIHKLQINKK